MKCLLFCSDEKVGDDEPLSGATKPPKSRDLFSEEYVCVHNVRGVARIESYGRHSHLFIIRD